MVDQRELLRRGDELIARTARIDAAVTWSVVVVLVVASWGVSYALGGSQTVGPQLFHLPVVLAAARFGARGSFIAAVLAGLASGPILPLDVAEGEAQSVANWGSRLVIFLVVGQMVASLHSRSVGAARRRISDHQVASDLLDAVADGEIVPAYQPIVDLRTGEIEGVEALARWRRPDGELLGPAAFIDDAERTGVVHAIDRSILAQAAAQVAAWHEASLIPGAFRLSVNLSAHHLAEPDIVASIRDVLAESGISPACLVLEITETGLVSDPEGIACRLEELRGLGATVSLDDFGVGTSSLGNLMRFPIDAFKIDRSFILGAEGSDRGRALAGSVIGMAGRLGLSSPVAEGIETEEQRRTLVELGCARGQGFLFSRPVLAAEAEELLRRGRCPIAGG
ncbi:EAL domain-containing protein [Actinomarinicola tropica]|nr:EAL domain-containing protein [Actinomarinicola tropica]